jgi:hypothetical protein
MKKSPYISSADHDKIVAQRRKEFAEKYNKKPKSEKKEKTFQKTLSDSVAVTKDLKKDTMYPEVIPKYDGKTRRISKPDDEGKSLGFNAGRFGNIILADQLSILNKRNKERDTQRDRENAAREAREQERKNVEILRRKEERAYAKKQEESEKQELTKKQLAQAERDRFGRNYQAKDYASHIYAHTSSQVIRKPFNRSGLRNEWQARMYRDSTSGMPAADYKNTTSNLVLGRVKGTLDIGGPRLKTVTTTKGKLSTKNRVAPNLFDLNISLGSGNTGLGSGSVIMPVGLVKIKKRGGRFNPYS